MSPELLPDTVEVPRPTGEPDTKMFWESKSFWGALLFALGFIFKSLKMDESARDPLAGALATLGMAGIAWGRQTAKKKIRWWGKR